MENKNNVKQVQTGANGILLICRRNQTEKFGARSDGQELSAVIQKTES